jgi:hypothetical protein
LMLPALLALWLAVLAGSASGAHATAIEWGAGCNALSIATTPINHDNGVAFSQWSDEDDDRPAPASWTSPWAPLTNSDLAFVARDVPCGTPLLCTALPRGPPSV